MLSRAPVQELSQSTGSIKRHKYVPDLRGFMRLCEANYGLILKLFPYWLTSQSSAASWSDDSLTQIHLRCQVMERTPYTLLLQFDQHPVLEPWIKALSIQVRLYHDARMAEVILFQHQRPRLPQALQFAVHMADEKNQTNQFLHEWLRYCLRHKNQTLLG